MAESVDVDADGGFGEDTADTIWGLTYIDEAIVSRRIGNGSRIGKGDPIYHLYDAQFSVVGRMVDDGGILPRMVERIVYSVYGEPTVYPYSYADCADTSGNEGPDGILSSDDQTKFNAWYGATPKDVRADISDINSVVPMVLADNVTGAGNNYVTADDATAFSNEYGANAGTTIPVAGFVSLPPMGWSGGGGLTFNGASDTPVSDIGYCGYAWNNGSAQYAVRFRNYDPGLGRWLQRDPLGYVDGMSLFSYAMSTPTLESDPTGLWPGLFAIYARAYLRQLCEQSYTPHMNPITPSAEITPMEDYFKMWKEANPGYSAKQYGEMLYALKQGCIGITICNLGCFGSNPDRTDCYATPAQAEARLSQMRDNCTCKGKGKPVMFGFAFWSNPNKPDSDLKAFQPDPSSGKVDMSAYNPNSRRIKKSGTSCVNFDYAWPIGGKWLHANHCDPSIDPKTYKPGDIMKIYHDDWPEDDDEAHRHHDRRVYCVTCSKQNLKPEPIKP